MTASAGADWLDLLSTGHDPAATWRALFAQLRDLALADPAPRRCTSS